MNQPQRRLFGLGRSRSQNCGCRVRTETVTTWVGITSKRSIDPCPGHHAEIVAAVIAHQEVVTGVSR